MHTHSGQSYLYFTYEMNSASSKQFPMTNWKQFNSMGNPLAVWEIEYK